jgi:putative membrane protein
MEPERSIMAAQFGLMEKRLYNIIMNPAMIITYIGGFTMIFYYGWDWFAANSWMHWKLGFVFLLTGYHHYNKKIIQKLKKGEVFMTSNQLRFYNEIATLLLLAIVLLAVFKSRLDFIYAFVTIIIFVLLLVLGIRLYRRLRG